MSRLLMLVLLIAISSTVYSQGIPVKVKITVTNYSGEILTGEQVWLKSVKTKKIYKGTSDDQGLIDMEVIGPDNYHIILKSVGKETDYSKLVLPTLPKGSVYGTYELFIEIDPAKEFTLDHVFFESGKSILKSESYSELDELAEYLNSKKSVVIEISGHTDNEGDDAGNLILSQDRAKSVKTYLVTKGIDQLRIKPVGYGEQVPIADNSTEQGRKLNRRTEVKILKE